MAASVLVMLPVLILFFVAQKSFVQGISTTGMKG
jgi:multiple sugar transport system permease protein